MDGQDYQEGCNERVGGTSLLVEDAKEIKKHLDASNVKFLYTSKLFKF